MEVRRPRINPVSGHTNDLKMVLVDASLWRTEASEQDNMTGKACPAWCLQHGTSVVTLLWRPCLKATQYMYTHFMTGNCYIW